MKIAMVVNNYPPKTGGLEYHVENLARALTELGHQVWVLNIANQRQVRRDHGVTILTGKAHLPIADVITVPALGATRTIADFLESHHVDLVATHTRFFPMSFVGLRAAQKAGIPVIHTEHGSGFVATKNPIIWLGSRFVDLTMGRFILNHAKAVLGVSQPVVDFVSQLSSAHAELFYAPITPSQNDSIPSDNLRHLVYVGRMVPGKGWDTFIDVVAQLRAQGFEVDADMLGDGPNLQHAKDRVAELGLSEIITLHGRTEPTEVRKFLRGATLVNPSVLAEGYQTTLVEASAEGGRVVTFPVPSASVLAEKGASIAICKDRTTDALAETVATVLKNPPPLTDPQVIDSLTWPAQAQKYAELCQQVIEEL